MRFIRLILPDRHGSVVTRQLVSSVGLERRALGNVTFLFAALLLSLGRWPGVFRVCGSHSGKRSWLSTAHAARGASAHNAHTAMNHRPPYPAWLITDPPVSGRSIAALCFAGGAACTPMASPGCRGMAPRLHTTMAGTTPTGVGSIPEGLSIVVGQNCETSWRSRRWRRTWRGDRG